MGQLLSHFNSLLRVNSSEEASLCETVSSSHIGLPYTFSKPGLCICFVFLQMDEQFFSYNFSLEAEFLRAKWLVLGKVTGLFCILYFTLDVVKLNKFVSSVCAFSDSQLKAICPLDTGFEIRYTKTHVLMVQNVIHILLIG